jgi:hypothetical protein
MYASAAVLSLLHHTKVGGNLSHLLEYAEPVQLRVFEAHPQVRSYLMIRALEAIHVVTGARTNPNILKQHLSWPWICACRHAR